MDSTYENWLPKIFSIANRAGDAIIAISKEKKYSIQSKLDNSPVTEADLAAQQIILKGLKELDPNIPIISEENAATAEEMRMNWHRFWLVDPLDGTKEFIKGSSEFTINIALIENHQPVLGLVFAPKLDCYYYAIKGGPAFKVNSKSDPISIQVAANPKPPYQVAVSRHHNEKTESWNQLLSSLGAVDLIPLGSALKICLIAEGLADVYPRFGSTGEWDTAAGQCILEAAGGYLVDLNGQPLLYNQRPTLINPSFYAFGSKKLMHICCG